MCFNVLGSGAQTTEVQCMEPGGGCEASTVRDLQESR